MAISLPDDIFDRVSARARDLGLTRSEFFIRAARSYLAELDGEAITQQIDAALAQFASTDRSSAQAVAADHRLLAALDDEW